jgi:hypothetical protein
MIHHPKFRHPVRMVTINWASALDFSRAAENVRSEFYGDWHDDPWGWPEIDYILKSGPDLLVDHLGASGFRLPALVDVPKENWGSRPAVVLDILDRLAYQALVDRSSIDLIGDLNLGVYGWRLPPSGPKRGGYSHNNLQWDRYRDHLSASTIFDAALRTDLVSCFASMPLDLVQGAIDDRLPKGAIRDRLLSMLAGFNATPTRSGLPQRSLASAVIANMYLAPLDDVLEHYASDIPWLPLLGRKKGTRRRSWVRWMDDMWLFGDDASLLRRAQLELQSAARSLGMHINSAKTDVLEGDDVAEQALQIEHSAVEDALKNRKDQEPLELLVDRLLESPETAGRTSLKFAVARMREHGSHYRIQEFLQLAARMPHAADSLAALFKDVFTRSSLQDWFLEYADSSWASFEWSIAHFMRMFPSQTKPRKALRDFVATRLADPKSSLPLVASCAQRLAEWDPQEARAVVRAVEPVTTHPQSRRVLAIAALAAGERRTTVGKWLGQHDENLVTIKMLERMNYTPPKAANGYAS